MNICSVANNIFVSPPNILKHIHKLLTSKTILNVKNSNKKIAKKTAVKTSKKEDLT